MRCFTGGLVLCLLTASASRGQDKFDVAVRIQAGGMPIDVGGFRGAVPLVEDFDGDGLNDLLVGQDQPPRLRIYRNRGTNQKPQFDDFEWFRANGEVAELPGYGLFRPQLADLDGDGQLDIITASDSGMIFWYRRDAGGEFADAELVRLANGHVLNAGTNAACHVVDWDGDGDNDLIGCGRMNPDGPTELWWVENRGSQQSLSLAAPQPLEADGEPIRTSQIGVHPLAADWNGDGKWDLLLGLRDGSILLYENKGDRRASKLAAARPLIAPVRQARQPPDDDGPRRGTGGSICVIDWDHDGLLDLLVGDAQTEIIQPDVSQSADRLQEMRQESARVLEEYRRLRGLYRRLNEETQGKQREFVRQTRDKYTRRIEDLRDEVSKLEKAMQPQQQRHGYVWLLRRMDLH